MESINTVDTQSKFANRSLARTVAFQSLYQNDLNPGNLDEFTESFFAQELPDHVPLLRFARSLVFGTVEKCGEIDTILAGVAQNWSLSRMTPTDRNILRLATYEILYMGTPKPVVINEAVELAKKFGSKESAAFVNGILDKVNQSER